VVIYYSFLYQQKAGSISTDISYLTAIHTFFDDLTNGDFDECVRKDMLSKDECALKQEQLKLTLHSDVI
jgi:hypothetical protein